MTQPHDAPRRGTALPCRSAADQPDSNHQAQLTSLVPALHRCAPGPQDQPDPSNSSLSSPLYCIRLIRTLKYLLTKSYKYVIFLFAERESRLCVSRPSHCHRKSLGSCSHHSHSHAPATLLFSGAHTLFISCDLQPTHSERLAHSCEKHGGIPPFVPKRNCTFRVPRSRRLFTPRLGPLAAPKYAYT